jgi:8-oxo-dGTP pyrophosphatase MutT (NUDIX family)
MYGAGIILQNEQGELLCVQDSVTSKWSFPKGHCERTDSHLVDTAIRETLEETGLEHGVDYLIDKRMYIPLGNRHVYYPAVRLTQKEPVAVPGHSTAVRWLSLDELRNVPHNMGIRLFRKLYAPAR